MCYNLSPLSQHDEGLPALRSLHLFSDLKNVALPWTTSDLIKKATRFEATVPQDRVYSLVGLASEAAASSDIPMELQANYTKPCRDVFRDVTRYIIKSSESLGILTRIRCVQDWAEIPSWTVDFAGKAEWERLSYFSWRRSVRGGHEIRELLNNASLGLPVDLEASPSEDVLLLKGIQIDLLDEPYELMSLSNFDVLSSSILCAWREAHLRTRKRYLSMDSLARAFMVSLAANWSLTDKERMESQHLSHFWAYLWQAYTNLLNAADSEAQRKAIKQKFEGVLPPQTLEDNGDSDLYRLHLYAAHQRRIFITATQSFIGLGPRNMQQNDILCVLFGGATPMTLRAEGECYRFIGECYVYDLMSGEAIRDWRAGKHSAQTFCLV